MTPKEKAKHLIETYLKKIIELAYAETRTLKLAKESALICVEEILDLELLASDNYYWINVKEEINKL